MKAVSAIGAGPRRHERVRQIGARAGAAILDPLMSRHGFRFAVTKVGKGSGGHLALGEFRKHSLSLELVFRRGLIGVDYSACGARASHVEYMKALGASSPRYPGYPDDALGGFRHLLSDLEDFASEFLSGNTFTLRMVSAREKGRETNAVKFRKGRIGDEGILRRARERFRAADHREVCRLHSALQFPEALSAAEQQMFEISSRRVRDS